MIPEEMALTAQEKDEGCRLVRFLDQIVCLNRQGKAIRRHFFSSRNRAKLFNRLVTGLPVLRENPKNAPNCTNAMVQTTMPTRGPTKKELALGSRISDFMKLKPRHEGMYTKPGAL
jgi:hypothetical protein